jgi:hypothetical protein
MSEVVVEENLPGCIKDCSECWHFDPRSGICEMSGRE